MSPLVLVSLLTTCVCTNPLTKFGVARCPADKPAQNEGAVGEPAENAGSGPREVHIVPARYRYAFIVCSVLARLFCVSGGVCGVWTECL